MASFQRGEKFYAVGMNMACRRIVTSGTFVEAYDETRSVVITGGIKIAVPTSDLYKTRGEVKALLAAGN